MSHHFIEHSEDLCRLTEEGYTIRSRDGYLLVYGIPYFDQNRCICCGVFACPINATAQSTQPPQDHIMSFSGGIPHDQHGKPLLRALRGRPRFEVDGQTFQNDFSIKLGETNGPRNYKDFYEKVTTYAKIISGPVRQIDPSATAKACAHVQ